MARMIGTNNLLCLLAIPAGGAVPLAIFIAALRTLDPGRAGMVRNLAGAVAATFYLLIAPNHFPAFRHIADSTLAIAILAGVGALARCAVRW